jgi:hypothetical protein
MKGKFLREDHPHLVAGKEVILEEDGTSARWEQGIAELYEAYPDLWQTEKFASRTERAAFANFLIVAQAKKARADIVAEERKAAEASKPKAKAASQRVRRGRKRPAESESESDLPSSAPPKKKTPMPTLTFPSFSVCLRDRPVPPVTEYEKVFEFPALVAWILLLKPTWAGKRVMCWVDVVIRNEDSAEMFGLEVDSKIPMRLYSQSSWDSAVRVAQGNRRGESFSGLGLQIKDVDQLEIEQREPEVEFVLSVERSVGGLGEDGDSGEGTRAGGPKGKGKEIANVGEDLVGEGSGSGGAVDGAQDEGPTRGEHH